MPTVHLSLPNSVYTRLKEKAASMGIQVTDLIKIYIKMGLDGRLEEGGGKDKELEALYNKIDELERRVRSNTVGVITMRGKLREIEELVAYLIQRIETLEEQIVASREDISIKFEEG